jgi:hypothetical protein
LYLSISFGSVTSRRGRRETLLDIIKTKHTAQKLREMAKRKEHGREIEKKKK